MSRFKPGIDGIFIQKDVSLLKNVDSACEEIKSQEQRADLLFMSQGYLTFAGRNGMSIVSPSLDASFLPV